MGWGVTTKVNYFLKTGDIRVFEANKYKEE